MTLSTLTIGEAAAGLRKKEFTAEELTREVLARIEARNETYGAYLTITAEAAIEAAKDADRRLNQEDPPALCGIPVSIKDVLCTEGIRTTCGSKILEHFIPPYDATAVARLKDRGMVIVGKTNMDEFAMGSSTENSGFHPAKNPWDLSRIPGGSSGGAAISVAADMALSAVGSDTGGSIRQPASHCGVVGMKPTYGRVSRYGLVAFASSLDQVGPFAKCVPDIAVLMNALAGYDPADSTSVNIPVPDYTAALKDGLTGVTVGLPKEYFEMEGLHPDVESAVREAVRVIEELGAKPVSVSLPRTREVVAVYYIIAPCEASSNLARYDGVKYGMRDETAADLLQMYRETRSRGFGSEVQRRIIVGTYCLSAGYYDAYYRKASQVRSLIVEDFKKAFESCDVILGPAAPTPAFTIGEKVDDPLTMYLTDIFTLSANLAGIPGISVPCGLSRNYGATPLPVGLQILGRHFDEEMLLRVAYNFEQATEHHKLTPPLHDSKSSRIAGDRL
jgi:aspartyl-tRNA(Asn)/glutamyl-tRNA(Gln) amidotransferase subunit A